MRHCFSPDYKAQIMGQTLRRTIIQAFRSMTRSIPLLTHEVIDAYEKEVNEPDRSYILDFYIVSAQRSDFV
jgi:hypothetical protein